MNPFNETSTITCPEETPEALYILCYCCIAIWITGFLLVSSLLVFVALRARNIVKEREKNPYPYPYSDSNSSVSSGSTRSSVSVGEDHGQSIQSIIKSAYQPIPEEYLDHSSSTTADSNPRTRFR